jgi:hypothetical protein
MGKSSQPLPFQAVIGHDLLYLPWFCRPPRPGAIPRCSSVTERDTLPPDPAIRYSPDLPTSEERPLGDHALVAHQRSSEHSAQIFSAFSLRRSDLRKMKQFKFSSVHGGPPAADSSPFANVSADRHFSVGRGTPAASAAGQDPPNPSSERLRSNPDMPSGGRIIPRAPPRVQTTAVRRWRCPSSWSRGVLARGGWAARRRELRVGEIDGFLARRERCESVRSSASCGVGRARVLDIERRAASPPLGPGHRVDAEEHSGREACCSFGWAGWIRQDWAKTGKSGAIRRRTVER